MKWIFLPVTILLATCLTAPVKAEIKPQSHRSNVRVTAISSSSTRGLSVSSRKVGYRGRRFHSNYPYYRRGARSIYPHPKSFHTYRSRRGYSSRRYYSRGYNNCSCCYRVPFSRRRSYSNYSRNSY